MNFPICAILLFFCFYHLNAQQLPGWYWVQLSDKDHSPFAIERPDEFLSARALQRRANQHIPISENDLPVSKYYCDSLTKLGIPLINRSKWFNAVTTDNLDTNQVNMLLQLGFIKKIQRTKPGSIVKTSTIPGGVKISESEAGYNYGLGTEQISIHNGDLLHNLGYTGKGIHIAIIDAGFNNANMLPAFNKLWYSHQILGIRDFVDPGSNIFDEDGHGAYILSVLGSYSPGILTGVAPEASFWLLRSEDVNSEYLIEEDNWVSAAEFADSAGVDIINTSLGYTTFFDYTQDHNYGDMDGNTTRISIAADIAASKGILLVNSASNEGNHSWKYIAAPSDADSVLAVGAVNSFGVIAPFSSRGPSSDGRIKPNVCSVGWGTYMFLPNGELVQGNGTSLSSPIIAGLSACLWQANRKATNMEIFDAIQQSSDRFENPDTIYGYGIPDFYKANLILKTNYRSNIDTTFTFNLFPNPFLHEVYLSAESDSEAEAVISVYNQTGYLVSKSVINFITGYNLILIDNLSELAPGVYFIKIQSDNMSSNKIILKL